LRHEKIYAALAAYKRQEAAQAMFDHIIRSMNDMLTRFKVS
jgi:DNA-binding GntR family transcriptional regulator